LAFELFRRHALDRELPTGDRLGWLGDLVRAERFRPAGLDRFARAPL
jgi:hypothetical protein